MASILPSRPKAEAIATSCSHEWPGNVAWLHSIFSCKGGSEERVCVGGWIGMTPGACVWGALMGCRESWSASAHSLEVPSLTA